MRIPTLAGLTEGTRRVVARFPEVMLVALAAALFGHLAIRNETPRFDQWAPWVAAAALGSSAFFAVAIVTERLRPAGAGRFGAPRLAGSLLAIGLLVVFALRWDGWSESIRFHRLVQTGVALHLFVAFGPFLGRREPNAFWQYNRILFVRALVGVLFSGVLFVGLAIALASAKPLFGIAIPERRYFDLWLAIAFLFNTGYVMAGVPEDVGALEHETHYPQGLRVFAQFILLPLVTVYLVILTAYLFKVLVTQQWPNGWIGWLVSSVSAAGLLSLLLVHPVRERAENRWVSVYARWFHLALMPSVAMLFAAIGKRIGQYGYTEDRYFLLALACWIAVITVVYTVRRAADIRWIPITLCALAVGTAFGPWGAYGVSRTDQARRLARMLAPLGLAADSVSARPANPPDWQARKALSSGIAYLAGTYGVAALPPPLRRLAEADTSLHAANDRVRRPGSGEVVARSVMRQLGLAYVDPWETEGRKSVYLGLGPVASHVEALAGADFAVSLKGRPPIVFEIGDGSGRLDLDARARALAVEVPWGRWMFPLDSTLGDLEVRGEFPSGRPRNPIRLAAGPGPDSARVVLDEFEVSMQADTLDFATLGGTLYLPGPGRAH